MESQALGRLCLAVVCVGVLVAARWRYEQPPGGLVHTAHVPALPERMLRARARRGRRRPLGRLGVASLWLYWAGLTTSAALAGQAVATLYVLARTA